MTISQERYRFLFRNLLRGLSFLAILIVLFVLAKEFAPENSREMLKPLYDHPLLVFAVFMSSEIVFGIIPPEVFMMWALDFGTNYDYVWIVGLLSVLSYSAGLIGFGIGRWFNHTRLYRLLRRRYLGKYARILKEYGMFLIIVAAVTPLPYSAVSMVIGSVNYRFDRFLYYSTTRFLRFGVYGYIIWEANEMS